jgi:6-phosphogluconolactonase (cycloisomerase 2 family)
MPLLSTRSSASSAGYGQNLSGFSNVPMYDQGNLTVLGNGLSAYSSLFVSQDGTAAFVIGSKRAIGFANDDYYLVSFSRNTSTGALTVVSQLQFYSLAPISPNFALTLSPNNNYVYVSFYFSTTSTIYQFGVNSSTKAVTPLSPASVSGAASTYYSSMTVSSDSKFLYVGSFLTNKIFIYSINATTGFLTLSNVYTTPANTRPYYPKISGDGFYLYCSSYGTANNSNGLLQYSRNSVTGDITPLSPEGVTTSGNTGPINLTPNSNFIGVSSSGTIYNYGRNSPTGLLTLASTQSGTLGVVAYSADSNNVYASNSVQNNNSTISGTYQGTVDPAFGFFTAIPGVTYYGFGTRVVYLTASPDYQFYYAINLGLVITFQVIGGYLTPINTPTNGSHLNYTNVGSPGVFAYGRQAAISPDGKSVYTQGYKTNGTVGQITQGSQFNRNTTTGVLTYASASSSGTQEGYGGLVVSPNSDFLYSVDVAGTAVKQYSRNTTTGNLTALSPASTAITAIGTFYFGNTPAISSDGTGVYVPCSSSTGGTIPYLMQYTRNTSTGLLTGISTINIGAVANTSSFPMAVVSPNNNFVYASDGLNNINVYSRNTTTNVLTSIFTYALSGASAFCLSSDGLFLYNIYSSTIDIYGVNTTTGALTFLSTKSFTNKTDYVPFFGYGGIPTVSSDGSALYVNTRNTVGFPYNPPEATLYQFLRNQSTGALSNLKTFNVLFDSFWPQSVVYGVQVSPNGKQAYFVSNLYVTQVNL